jgi:hypothetical protein
VDNTVLVFYNRERWGINIIDLYLYPPPPPPMSPFFIDFEAFQHGNERYMIKELCILSTNYANRPMYMLFRPSNQWHKLSMTHKQTYAYQTNHLHHIQWNEGFMRYCRKCIFSIINTSFPNCRSETFYVMGAQKQQFLKREFPQLHFVNYNVTFTQLPRLCGNSHCLYRNHGEHCAFLKCYQLYYHYMMLY